MISTLLYADDIVLISPSAENLQTIFNYGEKNGG